MFFCAGRPEPGIPLVTSRRGSPLVKSSVDTGGEFEIHLNSIAFTV